MGRERDGGGRSRGREGGGENCSPCPPWVRLLLQCQLEGGEGERVGREREGKRERGGEREGGGEGEGRGRGRGRGRELLLPDLGNAAATLSAWGRRGRERVGREGVGREGGVGERER